MACRNSSHNLRCARELGAASVWRPLRDDGAVSNISSDRVSIMKLPRRQFLHLAAGAAALLALFSLLTFSNSAFSQTTRTIKLVVPYSPGGVTDSMMRMLADQIGRTQGVTVVVENRPGAGTVIGTEAVSRAAPDGNTVLLVGNSFVINPHIRKLTYDPLNFEPVCYLVRSPTVVAVNGGSNYHTLSDLLTAARAQPGGLSLAASGPGTGFHMAFEMLKRAAHIDMTFVPYAGTTPAVNALLGAHVVAAIGDYGPMAEHFRSGKLRALATVTGARIEPLPDVPTVVEAGFPGFEVDIWYGIVAPAKTSKEAVSQLAKWFAAAMQVPDFRAKVVALGLYPVGSCDTDFGAHLRKQYQEYARIIREANIKAE
jgi:tripartite-type tricarboxylate transporter receptor subunit TctC